MKPTFFKKHAELICKECKRCPWNNEVKGCRFLKECHFLKERIRYIKRAYAAFTPTVSEIEDVIAKTFIGDTKQMMTVSYAVLTLIKQKRGEV